MKKAAVPKFRCAIYTRVSTDDGLDQEFNSLDAQREAAEAYIKSQASEGWTLVPAQFNDGGYSGGSMERPALQLLLDAIRLKRVDIVVVYKVDRLTRSLADFAKLVDLFDAHKVTFVSVTQSFNTTTSMGRLTLNMLLSFAQFEREVTGERIRDKIAASKKRGIWVGGVIALGYRVENRKLLVDQAEAAVVRRIFERYLALGSLPRLQVELRDSGVTTRLRILASGKQIGGAALTNGPLAYLLRNRIYLGEINHKGASYKGEHQAIVEHDLFEAVQARLLSNLNGPRKKRQASEALLLGRLQDEHGHTMTPSTAKKGSLRYRYYVSCVLAQGRSKEAGAVKRVSAPEIEAIIIDALRSRDPAPDLDDVAFVAGRLETARLHQDRIELNLTSGESVQLPWSPKTRARREIIGPASAQTPRPIKAEARVVLLRSIALGRLWLDQLVKGSVTSLDALAAREGCSKRHVERTISNAFLAPQIIKAAVDGQLPRGVNAKALMNAPAEWTQQWNGLGLQRS
jgi:site-specific DNA recombinase